MLRKNHRCGDKGEENGLHFYPNYDLQSKRAGSLDGKRILYKPIFKQFQTRRDVWYNKKLMNKLHDVYYVIKNLKLLYI